MRHGTPPETRRRGHGQGPIGGRRDRKGSSATLRGMDYICRMCPLPVPLGFATREATELHRKYSDMLAMRVAHAAGDEVPAVARAHMVALATRFPGALREIDRLEVDEIRKRIALLEDVRAGSRDPEPWMRSMTAFHAFTRGALCAKRWLAGRKRVDETLERSYVASIERFAFPEDAFLWKDELRALASPPEGRVSTLVFAKIAHALGITERQARRHVLGAFCDEGNAGGAVPSGSAPERTALKA